MTHEIVCASCLLRRQDDETGWITLVATRPARFYCPNCWDAVPIKAAA